MIRERYFGSENSHFSAASVTGAFCSDRRSHARSSELKSFPSGRDAAIQSTVKTVLRRQFSAKAAKLCYEPEGRIAGAKAKARRMRGRIMTDETKKDNPSPVSEGKPH